jgi:hypothetical protein
MNLPKPETICEKCLKDEHQKDSKSIRVFCKHNRAGGTMQIIGGIPTGVWFVISPATAELATFMSNLIAAAVKE